MGNVVGVFHTSMQLQYVVMRIQYVLQKSLISSSVFFLFGFSISTFSGLLSLFHIHLFLLYVFLITSLHLSFGLPICQGPPTSIFSLLHLLQSFSPHGLTISVSLLLWSHVCLPHLPLLLSLHSGSSQSSFSIILYHFYSF